MVVTLGSPLGAFSLLLARSLKTHFTAYTAEQQEHFFFFSAQPKPGLCNRAQ